MSKHPYFWPLVLALSFILGLVMIVIAGDQPTLLGWCGLLLVSFSPVVLIGVLFRRHGPWH